MPTMSSRKGPRLVSFMICLDWKEVQKSGIRMGRNTRRFKWKGKEGHGSAFDKSKSLLTQSVVIVSQKDSL